MARKNNIDKIGHVHYTSIFSRSSLAHLCEDTSKILLATRSCFGHTSIDYTYQINILFDQHKVEFVELLLSYINIHKAFFHQGHELLSIDTEGDFNSITSQVKIIDESLILIHIVVD